MKVTFGTPVLSANQKDKALGVVVRKGSNATVAFKNGELVASLNTEDKAQVDVEAAPTAVSPQGVLDAIKDFVKRTLKGTAKEQLNTIPSLVKKLKRLGADADNIGSGEAANAIGRIVSRLETLKSKVDDKKITSASKFKELFKALADQILELQLSSDGLDSMKEGVEELKNLKYTSLNSVFKNDKQLATFIEVPVVVTGGIPRTVKVKLQPYWKFEPILESGYLIKGVKFVVLNAKKILPASRPDFIKSLILEANKVTRNNPVIPYFDISVTRDNLMAVMLIPEKEARYAAQIFDSVSFEVYLR
jgi:hypothetical protein